MSEKKYCVDFRQIDSKFFCVKSTLIDAFSKNGKQQFYAKCRHKRIIREINFDLTPKKQNVSFVSRTFQVKTD